MRELLVSETEEITGGTGSRLPNSQFPQFLGSMSDLNARGLDTSSPASPPPSLSAPEDDYGSAEPDQESDS